MKLYMQLPDGSVPQELLNRSGIITEIRFVTREPGSKRRSGFVISVPEPDLLCPEPGLDFACSPHVRFYQLNSPLEKIHADMMEATREALTLRSSLATMADILGSKDEIPTATNHLSWTSLASSLVHKLHQLTCHVRTRVKEIFGEKIVPEKLGLKKES